MKKIKIWCDGAFKPSLQQGGIGVVWVYKNKVVHVYSKGFKNSEEFKVTNQTMEIFAAMIALLSVKTELESLEIVTDSMYVIGCASLGWKRKSNIKLWNKFDKVLEDAQKLVKTKIKFTHTRGHESDELNNLADELASEASKEFIK